MTDKEDVIHIGCMTRKMGEWNPSNIVEGCVFKQCALCETDIYVSPNSQKLLATNPAVKAVCTPCMLKKANEEAAKGEEIKWMGIVPENPEDAARDVERFKAERKKK